MGNILQKMNFVAEPEPPTPKWGDPEPKVKPPKKGLLRTVPNNSFLGRKFLGSAVFTASKVMQL